MRIHLYLCILAGMACTAAYAQTGRLTLAQHTGWKFSKLDGKSGVSTVNLPHTWNIDDVNDDEPGYYRGTGRYTKSLFASPSWKDKEVYLYVEAAGQEARVLINGVEAATHRGGYTGFHVPLSRQLRYGKANTITIDVTNRVNPDLAPLSADFTFYGGLYRGVRLLVTSKAHFETDHGADAVFVTTPQVSQKAAVVRVAGTITNRFDHLRKLKVLTLLNDAEGRLIRRCESPVSALANQAIDFSHETTAIPGPKLWSPEDPYLYVATTRLIDARSGAILDEVRRTVGFRWFSFDPDKGFFLNGASYKLIGASRHQDYHGYGNAVPARLQVRDVELLKQMGGNFLRVSHYPQDQVVMDACDRLGMLTSVEIPVVNEITESQAFFENCKSMQLEMIRQNYNHPSVIIWAYMNEVLLRPKFGNDKPRQEIYFSSVKKLAQALDSLTRKADPTRYTMIANHGDYNRYNNAGLLEVPMLVGWNLYSGWYGGKIEDFGRNLDEIHQKLPGKPLLVTEYGADADPRIHSMQPEKFDKSAEYALAYHQGYLKDILARPFVAAAAVWNLADFNSETRGETMPHINNKGLLTFDRQPKNTFFLYCASLRKTPYLKIGDGNWKLRSGIAGANDSCSQLLQVFSNAPEVELFLSGKSLGKKPVINNVASWAVPFANGTNDIRATAELNGQKLMDESSISFQLQPGSLLSTRLPFKQINISVGDRRLITDFANRLTWLPDQQYSPGSWGHIGGEVFTMKGNSRQSFGTDKAIAGTEMDPVYQTQLTGLNEYRLDVPNGNYEVTLYFAELTGTPQAALLYNLDATKAVSDAEARIFSVAINGKTVINEMDLARQYGAATAVRKRFSIAAANGDGIRILFTAQTGKAVLNGLQVKKL